MQNKPQIRKQNKKCINSMERLKTNEQVRKHNNTHKSTFFCHSLLYFLHVLIDRCLVQSAFSIPFATYTLLFCFVWLVVVLSDLLFCFRKCYCVFSLSIAFINLLFCFRNCGLFCTSQHTLRIILIHFWTLIVSLKQSNS